MLFRLQSEDNSALAFVYCDHVSREEQTATHLMGALLGQLISCISSDNTIAKELIEYRRNKRLLKLETSLDYIRRIASSGQFRFVRLGADGLDELLPEHRAVLLASLGSLTTISHIQLLYFGRDNSGIQTDVDNSLDGSNSFICYTITPKSMEDDRQLFLQQCLDRSKDWRLLDDGLKNMIFSRLAGPDSTSVLLLVLINKANHMP
jgi:hypothetical protein